MTVRARDQRRRAEASATAPHQTWVRIGIEREGDGVRFAVRDDGPGVPAADHEQIFEPGRRVAGPAAAATLTSSGAGLGLALCRRLARSAGGDVLAETSETGASFVVTLPAA